MLCVAAAVVIMVFVAYDWFPVVLLQCRALLLLLRLWCWLLVVCFFCCDVLVLCVVVAIVIMSYVV